MGEIICFEKYLKKEKNTGKNNSIKKTGFNDKLTEGILTFDRLYDYYINHEEYSYMYNIATKQYSSKEEYLNLAKDHEERMIYIRRILTIKRYSNISKINYLTIARDIVSKGKILEELQNISDLTKYYINNKEIIDFMDITDLKKIVEKKGRMLKDEN